MAIADYCHPAETIAPHESLREAARRMDERNLGALVVLDEERVAGLVTDRGVALAVIREGRDADSSSVGELIDDEPVFVHSHMPLGVAAGVMRNRGLRRLPVVDKQERLVGVLALDDLLRLFSGEIAALGDVATAQLPHGTPREERS